VGACPPLIGSSPMSYPAPAGVPFSPPGQNYVPGYGQSPRRPIPYAGTSLPANGTRPLGPPASPRPIIRALPEEEPPTSTPLRPKNPPPLTLPLPEQLGIGVVQSPPPASLDWNTVHDRLQRLGSLTYQLQKLPEGGFRFICLLPTTQPDRAQCIEAQGRSEGEAVGFALARAEQWFTQGR
jgi:hypothetical protein